MHIGGHALLPGSLDLPAWNEAEVLGGELFWKETSLSLEGEGRDNSVNLTELFALLMFLIGLLTLIVEVIRLTFEVTTFFQKQEQENKKD